MQIFLMLQKADIPHETFQDQILFTSPSGNHKILLFLLPINPYHLQHSTSSHSFCPKTPTKTILPHPNASRLLDNHPNCCCCLPTPMTLASGGSPMFPLVVHQWPAVQSLWRGLSTNPGPGVIMWCVCGCS